MVALTLVTGPSRPYRWLEPQELGEQVSHPEIRDPAPVHQEPYSSVEIGAR